VTNPPHDGTTRPSAATASPPSRRSAATGTPDRAQGHHRTWPHGAVDIELPNDARVHDALLGGVYNFHADRLLAGQLAATAPDLVHDLYAERHFVDRAIRVCIDAGIRQFIDLGCGMPSVGNVRTEVRHAAPDARVLGVDLDPVVVELLTWTLRDDDQAGVICADLRRPDDILQHPTTQSLLTLTEPVAVLAISVLHLLDQPGTVVHPILRRMAPGSFLVASHLTADASPHDIAVLTALSQATGIGWTPRASAEIQDLFTGLRLVRPGVVYARQWRPDPDDHCIPNPRKGLVLTGVARTAVVGRRRREADS
jgi:O-methyltransferase involved in polyketide biosynthesis